MAKIVLARVDSRLIHGQVITKWIKQYPANRIMIVDDALAKDSFMSEIYMMAAPNGVKVDIVDVKTAANRLFGPDATEDKVFLLFKSIKTCCEAIEAGVKVERLIVGGVPSAPGKKFLISGVYLDAAEVEQIKQLNQGGVEVVVRATPEEAELSYRKIMDKMGE